jgi:DNA mismatch repair protein MutS
LEHRDHAVLATVESGRVSTPTILPLLEHNELYDALDSLEPDSLSPREALDWLYKLKAISAKIR